MSVFCYASVNSTCVQPHPPGYRGAFARLVSPRGGAFANFALPGAGQAYSRCYACISSFLIKPKLHSAIGATDVNQRFGY